VTAPARPPLLFILAAFGMILGGFGMLYAMTAGAALLAPRDAYLQAHHEAAEKQLGGATPEAREELVRLTEKQADVIWSRRGVALPLAAIDLILSFLMLAGCLRALRGQSWGLSAWLLALKLSIPYVILDSAFSFVRARDMAAIYRDTTGPFGLMAQSMLSLQSLTTLVKSTLELLYCGAAILYLRRPQIRALFRDGGRS